MKSLGVELGPYRIADVDHLLTPALAIYADAVDHNVSSMLKLLGANRWRPHVKTSKLAFTMRRMVEHGLENLKCATTLELLTACGAGASDVLVAYPVVGAAVGRVLEIAAKFPATAISALVESAEQVDPWRGTRVGLFVDINCGMNRTGIELQRVDEIVRIARRVVEKGLRFRGLHSYEGHLHQFSLEERLAPAHRGYQQLLAVVAALEGAGLEVEEVITSGTPGFPCALAFAGFRSGRFLHRVSPGTVVYNDGTSLLQLPREYDLRPAVLVIATVVSRPSEGIITCDSGHKAVSVDAGVPSCEILGYPNLRPLPPSEEHLPIEVEPGSPAPRIGERVYLVPRHVCSTVNNFDHALIVTNGRVIGIERVSARGREAPLPAAGQLGVTNENHLRSDQ